MKFDEIFNESGMYVADGFAQGFCFEVTKNKTLHTMQHLDINDFMPTRETAIMYGDLLKKDYRKVLNRKQLFNMEE